MAKRNQHDLANFLVVFNRKISSLELALVGYGIMIANSELFTLLAIYQESNARSCNDCKL